MNNHNPTSQNGRLQEVFDETAAKASDEQLARMLARAEQIPQGNKPSPKPGWQAAWLIPVCAAAAVALALGWTALKSQTQDDTRVVATAIEAPTATPSTMVPGELSMVEQDESAAFFPADPLAVLDDEWEGDVWMSELDLLHGRGVDDDAYWEEMELLLEEGG